MPRNKQRDRDRDIDNPRVKPERSEAAVKTPRSFTGSDFTHFPKLVVQLSAPRPRREARVDKQTETPRENRPQESFARPLRGMGAGAYDGLREHLQPQMDAYRTAVHDAYADGTLTDDERQGLRQSRRGLRQDVRQYKRQNPLHAALGQRIGAVPKTPGLGGDMPAQSRMSLQQLQEAWKSGRLTPEEVLQALGFTGRLPNG